MARFQCATWRPINANTGGMVAPNLGLILHHAVMNGSTWALFNNPSTRASAHFWVGQGGQIEQHVDTNVVAWHGISLNSRYVGVETEGCGAPPHADPMSQAMIDALGRLYAEGMRVHGWPARLANRDGEPGCGFHRMAVNTACPCDVRLNMREEILRRAQGGAVAPPKPPTPKEIKMVSETVKTADNAVHVLQAAVSRTLWHKWSLDDGATWYNEPLIGAAGPPGFPIKANADSVSATVDGQFLFVASDDNESGLAWMSRQPLGAGWDIRQLP